MDWNWTDSASAFGPKSDSLMESMTDDADSTSKVFQESRPRFADCEHRNPYWVYAAPKKHWNDDELLMINNENSTADFSRHNKYYLPESRVMRCGAFSSTRRLYQRLRRNVLRGWLLRLRSHQISHRLQRSKQHQSSFPSNFYIRITLGKKKLYDIGFHASCEEMIVYWYLHQLRLGPSVASPSEDTVQQKIWIVFNQCL